MSVELTVPTARLAHGAASDTGRVRLGNEDSFAVHRELGLFVVADGLGGHRAGEIASRLAVECLVGAMRATADLPDDDVEEALLDGVVSADDAVRLLGRRREWSGMGSTLVAAWIPRSRRMRAVNVGDSRAYLLRGGDLTQLSVDDTAFEQLRRAGRLPADPAERPPRQQLTQALGGGGLVPHLERRDLVPGDRVVLCTDGLTAMLTDVEVGGLLSLRADPQEACEELIREANRRGGLDNTTVVVVDVVRTPGGPGTGAADGDR